MKATEINIVFEDDDGTVRVVRYTPVDPAPHLGSFLHGLECGNGEYYQLGEPVFSGPVLRKLTEVRGDWSSLNNEVYTSSTEGSLYAITLRDLMPELCNTAGEPQEYSFRFTVEAVPVKAKE